jgi:glycine betaine/choline ABC-type transport system substrate-binding protein
MRTLLAILAALFLLSGCQVGGGPVQIGAKGFTEQHILAHAIADLARDEGVRVRVVECGDTWGCHERLRQGQLDLMVEYTGTVLSLTGMTNGGNHPEEGHLQRAYMEYIYAQDGLQWIGELGFDNAYQVVLPTSRAAAMGLKSIADLTSLEDGVRVAAPPAYARRPVDGLHPLLRRYGLELADQPLLLEDPEARYQALFDGRADVAVAYATDGALEGRRLRVLGDPLDFFPPYRAGILARKDALERHPALKAVAERLEGQIDTATMRDLNARVQTRNQQPSRVAADFLRQSGLLPDAPIGGRESALRLVHHPGDRLALERDEALKMVRDVFPGRAVDIGESPEPLADLAAGEARLGLFGAERFFPPANGDERVRRDPRAEAVAVAGVRLLHIVRRRDDMGPPLRGQLGLLPAGSGAGRIGEAIARQAQGEVATRGSTEELVAAVRQGELDAALILAQAPDPDFAERLAHNEELVLRGLGEWLTPERSAKMPYLRPARIPAETYAHQDFPVETLGVQVVLAAPAPTGETTLLSGPAGALQTGSTPLQSHQVDALVEASPVGELPDPALPSPWSLRGGTDRGNDRAAEATLDSLLNLLVWAFLGWLVVLLLRQESTRGG